MVTGKATTPQQYLDELPPERREIVSTVRDLVLANLPPGYEESVRWGMLSYEVPLSRYPDTYNGQPLGFAGIAAQKRHYAVYLMCAYTDPAKERALREAHAAAGRKFDFGKSCLRFQRLDDVVWPAVAELIAGVPVDDYIALHEAGRQRGGKG